MDDLIEHSNHAPTSISQAGVILLNTVIMLRPVLRQAGVILLNTVIMIRPVLSQAGMILLNTVIMIRPVLIQAGVILFFYINYVFVLCSFGRVI